MTKSEMQLLRDRTASGYGVTPSLSLRAKNFFYRGAVFKMTCIEQKNCNHLAACIHETLTKEVYMVWSNRVYHLRKGFFFSLLIYSTVNNIALLMQGLWENKLPS